VSGCVFCEIVAGRAEASVVHEDAHTLAFMDLRQPTEGHVLVVPKRHVPDVFALGDDDAAAVMRAAAAIARALRSVVEMDGLSLWQSNGEAAGQEVPHFHLHLLPRRRGDGVFDVYPRGVPGPSARAGLEVIAAKLRAAM
jgi:histidine triad (HIT) family protein